MTKKQNIVTLIVGAVIIAALSFVIFLELSPNESIIKNQENISSELATTTENVLPRDWEETDDRKAVPADSVVLEVGSEVAEELKDVVAVPSIAISASPGSTEQSRAFQIKGEGNKFIPAQMTINFNDVIYIYFEAVDKDYDIIIPGYKIKQTAKQGETKLIAFSALKDGRFVYYCESCGGLESEAKGEIVVVK